jgi:hypothetical protein
MKFPNPCCPRCGRTAGIVLSAGPRQVISIYCASCDLTTLVQTAVEVCRECGGDRQNHVEGCSSERAWAV